MKVVIDRLICLAGVECQRHGETSRSDRQHRAVHILSGAAGRGAALPRAA